MKLIYDKDSLQGKYDNRGLTICKCGKHKYPSKKMFVDFLKQYVDVKGKADIWSVEDIPTGKVKIHIEIEYKIYTQKSTTPKKAGHNSQ